MPLYAPSGQDRWFLVLLPLLLLGNSPSGTFARLQGMHQPQPHCFNLRYTLLIRFQSVAAVSLFSAGPTRSSVVASCSNPSVLFKMTECETLSMERERIPSMSSDRWLAGTTSQRTLSSMIMPLSITNCIACNSQPPAVGPVLRLPS